MTTLFQQLQSQYQQGLHTLAAAITSARKEQVQQLFQLEETLKAYWHTAEQMTACDTELFVETFLRQAQQEEVPDVWPEALWYELSLITDKTQLQWWTLPTELAHRGLYQSEEQVGMGLYQCTACAEPFACYHPTVLPLCQKCGHPEFVRRGLPDAID